MSHYSNPVATAGDFADPFVLRHNGRYYLYCTNPDLRCWTSDDLVRWTPEGPTIAEDLFPGTVPFAPEVVYWNGYFYLYTSPSGTGHRVLRSPSPTGPFEPVTANLGRDIDGSVLVDDDGRWYFYWAGPSSILACEMASPTELGPAVDTGVTMHGWTEGPSVVKRDGWYHMTLTGNHYLSPGYRVNAAAGPHPLAGFHDDPLNPVLVSAEPPVVGLGHSSTVLGPDLVSHYLVYHNLNPDRSRDLNIDRQVWNGRSLQVLGPSTRAPAPARPDREGVPDPGTGWSVTGGVLRRGPVLAELSAEGPEAVALWGAAPVGSAFTSEHHLRLRGGVGGYGLVVAADSAATRIRFDPRRQVVDAVGPGGTVLAASPLPAGHDHGALHCARLEHDAGTLALVVDGRRQLTVPLRVEPGSVLGYFTETGPLELGYTASTDAVERLASRGAVKPVPGRFWAALTSSPVDRETVPGPVPRDRVVLREGQRLDHDLVAAGAGDHALFLTGAFARGTAVAVSLGDRTTVLAAEEDTAVLSWRCPLPAGPLSLRVTGVAGTAAIDLVTIGPVAAGDAEATAVGSVTGAGKQVLAAAGWSDYRVEAVLDVTVTDVGGHGDLIVRAGHLADGFEGNDPVLGIDFLLGYSVQLHPDRVVLARHDYDETVLARHDAPLDLSVPHRVTVTVRGSRLSVRVDDDRRLDHEDVLPHLVGGVGLRALGATVSARMTVTAG